MNGLDIAIAVSLLAAFVGGYRTGLVARVAAWAGVILGLLLMGSNLRAVLRAIGRDDSTHNPAEIAALLVAGAFAGKLVGLVLGRWLQRRLPTHPLRSANRLAGGSLGLAGVVATLWLTLPLLAQVPGWPSETSRTSAIARVVHDSLPAPPDTLGSIRRLVSGGRFPQVITELRRSLNGGDPPTEAVLDLSTQSAVQRSTVSVSVIACGVSSDGSGFSVGGGEVVTNAHVVAGAGELSVVDEDGVSHPSRVIAFDARRDLALVHVDGYTAPAMVLADAKVGDEVTVFGHPNGGPLVVRSAGVAQRVVAVGRDIYDRGRTSRAVLVLAGKLRPGDSGAAVVSRAGEVVGVAFAIAPDRSSTAYAIRNEELAAFLTNAAADALGTPASPTISGRCLTSQ